MKRVDFVTVLLHCSNQLGSVFNKVFNTIHCVKSARQCGGGDTNHKEESLGIAFSNDTSAVLGH